MSDTTKAVPEATICGQYTGFGCGSPLDADGHCTNIDFHTARFFAQRDIEVCGDIDCDCHNGGPCAWKS